MLNRASYRSIFLFIAVMMTCMVCAHLEGLTLARQIEKAQVGDYLVTCRSRAYTVLLVRAKFPNRVVLEEITLPAACAKGCVTTWKEWIRTGGPGNTSWVAYAINPRTGRVEHFYSYSREGWFDISKTDQFLTNLLSLPFEAVPSTERRKIGPAPSSHTEDKRKPWQPILVYEGEPRRNVSFDAWQANWPHDGTELAGRQVTIYTPECSNQYPAHFPYWIEVRALVGDNKIRVVDSGRGLQSPKPELKRLIAP